VCGGFETRTGIFVSKVYEWDTWSRDTKDHQGVLGVAIGIQVDSTGYDVGGGTGSITIGCEVFECARTTTREFVSKVFGVVRIKSMHK
jgi:phage terminase large subunit-like protein